MRLKTIVNCLTMAAAGLYSQLAGAGDYTLTSQQRALEILSQNPEAKVITTLGELEQIAQGSEPVNLTVEAGQYRFSDHFINMTAPVTVTGIGDTKPTIDACFMALNTFTLENITTHGLDQAESGLAIFNVGGGLINCDLSGNARIIINLCDDFIMVGNYVHDMLSTENTIIVESGNCKGYGNISIASNYFERLNVAFELRETAYAGINTANGGNAFINVHTVVDNPYNYPQDFSGNYFMDTDYNTGARVHPEKTGEYVYDDPLKILADKVTGAYKYLVDVSNPLKENPIPREEPEPSMPIAGAGILAGLLGCLGIKYSRRNE